MKIISKLFAVVILCASLAFTACSNTAAGVSSAVDENRSGTGLVTALDGGTVTYNNELTLTVPEQALAEDTTITVKRLTECPQKFDEGYTPLGQIYKFTPAGTTFSLDKPAVMELNYNETALLAAGLDARTVTLFYYDEENENYVAVESSVNTSSKKITAHVEHFTIYILLAKALLPGNNPPDVVIQGIIPTMIRAGAPIYVRATIRDTNTDGSIASARVYYRKRNPVVDAWQSVPMKKEVRPNTFDTYAAIIPASYLTSANLGTGNDLEIYVKAFDNLGASTQTATRGYTTTRTYNASEFTVTPTAVTIVAGFERTFTVQGRDSSGTSFQFIPESFSVSNDLGIVKNWGTQGIFFKAQKKGTGTLTVSDGTNSGSATIIVKNGDLASISIRDTNGFPISGILNLAPGSTYDFDVVGFDEFNNTVLVNPVWSADASIGTIDQTGKLTVGAGGTGNVTVTLGDLTATQQVKTLSTQKNMLTFSIGGYTGTISAPFITLTNYGTSNLNGLVAEFTTNGARVEVGGVVQTSGSSTNDFRTPVVYTVFAEDGSSQDYTVTVLIGVTGVSLNQSSLTVNTGNTAQLLATIAPANASNMAVTWSTSNPLVATVDSTGKVTGVAEGSATITVTTVDGGKTASCSVTVEDIHVTGVTLDLTNMNLLPGNTQQLTATVAPADATNKNVTWSSSNTSIATVDATGLVAAVAIGTATITVTTADQGKTAVCNVNVGADYTSPNIGVLKYVAGGSFQRDSNPANISTVSTFRMSQYKITQAQYVAVTGAANPSWNVTPNVVANNTSRPVDMVTWYDAVEFCNKLSTLEGLTPLYTITGRTPATGYPITGATVTATWTNNGYRLPTEMEWMYAAMGGLSDSRTGDIVSGINTGGYTKGYAGGTETGTATVNIGNYVWYRVNSYDMGSSSSDYGTHAVGTKLPNELGLYDMSGNLWEWSWDWYAAYPNNLLTDYLGSASGTYRVLRSSCWNMNDSSAAVAYRYYNNPYIQYHGLGFRVVRP